MVLEGDGWNVIDIGVNVAAGIFLETAQEHHGSMVGMSALLTTSLENINF